MAAMSATAPDRRAWNAVAISLLCCYVVGLILFSVAALSPNKLSGGWLAGYTSPTSWWPVPVQVLCGGGAFLAYYWPRRRETRAFSLVISSGLAVTTIVLGFLSYSNWTCSTATVSPVWTPLNWALNLFLGGVPTCADPAYVDPPALQVAQLSGLLLLVVAAVKIMTTVSRSAIDRLVIRFAARKIVVTGLSDDAIGLIRRLSVDRAPRTTLAVLVEDAANPLIKMARDLAARIAVCDVDDPQALRTLMTPPTPFPSRARFPVRALYAVSTNVPINLQWAALFRAIADSTKPSTSDMPPRMIVRIDDPWQAEYWRRTNAYRTPEQGKSSSVRWMSDSLSVYEVTAGLILDRILRGDFDRLVLIGSSPLALAVCAELAQREREGTLLGARPRPSFSEMVLFGADAETLRQQHRLRQEQFGNSTDWDLITVVRKPPTSEKLREVLAENPRPVLILADEPTALTPSPATYLAALNPTWTIFDWNPATRGVATEPIMEQLYPFGLTAAPESGSPVDSWERAARVVHESYRLANVTAPDPSVPSHRAWDDGLDGFLKESNIRLVTTTLAAAESAGRSWGPASHLADRGESSADDLGIRLDREQLDQMAQLEHASWLQHHIDNGWHYGVRRDDAARVHPAMVPWDRLDAPNREKTRQNVLAALSTLEGLGYHSTPSWIRAARTGEVTATQLDQPWSWTTHIGDVLHAAAGDWQVYGDNGRVWSVDPGVFARTYEHIAGDRWRRIGEVDARQAIAGEVVKSIEGEQRATAGDWVISGANGEQWVTSAEHFAANYRPLTQFRAVGPPSNRSASASG